MAESALLTLLLASIGDINTDLLATDFPGIRPYALSSRQVVDLMTRKYGIATSDDITKLREPLSLALTSLSDLESHMEKIYTAGLSARSGQCETPYHYFELYLLTVAGFPSVALSLTPYYVQYPALPRAEFDHTVSLPGKFAGPPHPDRPRFTLVWRRQGCFRSDDTFLLVGLTSA
jgi:hypothetical protein